MNWSTRVLARSRGFSLTAIAIIALGVALITTASGLVESVRHPEMPYRDPASIYSIRFQLKPPDVQLRADVRSTLLAQRQLYSDIASIDPNFFDHVTITNERIPIQSFGVSANYFQLLGTHPYLGRVFGSSDAVTPERAGVVVSYDTWARYLKRAKSLVGLTVSVAGNVYPVIGVLPALWGGPLPPYLGWPTIFRVLPREWEPGPQRLGMTWLVLRSRPTVTRAAVQTTIQRIVAGFDADHSGQRSIEYLFESPADPPKVFSPFLVALVLSVVVIFLIASGNVANLFAVRTLGRRQTIAVQLALGATPARIYKSLMGEAAVFGTLGGICGIGLATAALGVVRNHLTTGIVGLGIQVPRADWRVLSAGIASAFMVVFVMTLVSARRAMRTDVSQLLAGAANTQVPARGSGWRIVTAFEGALSLVVLMGAALLLRAGQAVRNYSFGYDPRGVSVYAGPAPRLDTTAGAADAFYANTLAGLEALPDVRAAATAVSHGAVDRTIASDEAARTMYMPAYTGVSSDFFRMLGVTPIAGRDFQPGDQNSDGAAIVDQSVSRALWPGAPAVGHMLKLGSPRSAAPWVRVIGVIPDIRLGFDANADPTEPPAHGVYVARADSGTENYGREFLVRTVNGRPEGLARATQYLAGVLRYKPTAQPLAGALQNEVQVRTYLGALFGLLALFALLLSTSGLYGIMSYSVNRRYQEFGVRLALGARRGDLVRAVVRDAAEVVLAGTALGAPLALWGGLIFRHWLFTVSPIDAGALVLAEVVLLIVSALGVVGPAIVASRADAVELLRVT